MDHVVDVTVVHGVEDLSKGSGRLTLTHLLVGHQPVKYLPIRSELRNDIHEAVRLHHLVQLDNILVGQSSHDLNLSANLVQVLFIQLSFVNYFYCNLGFC